MKVYYLQPRGLHRKIIPMPRRLIPFVDSEFYHIYNRGVEKRKIFTQPRDYKRFIRTLFYYQFTSPKPSFSKFAKSELNLFKPVLENKIAEVICYCLMPNHFHLLIRQLKDSGISTLLGQISNSYTKYFNTKYTRVGSLLQGTFKAVPIETDEQLLHVSRYIHLNPVVSGLVNKLDTYKWSSYSEFINGQESFCSSQEILNFFPSPPKYKEFVEDQIDYGTTLEILKHQGTIDLDE